MVSLDPELKCSSFTEKQIEAWVLPCPLICSQTPDFLALSWTPEHTGMHLLLLRGPASSQGPTYRRIPNTAGKGHPTALAARVQVSAVEVDIEVPVIGPSGATARPLGREESLGLGVHSWQLGLILEPHPPCLGQTQRRGQAGWKGQL